MQLTKFKITAPKLDGYMMVIYHDNNFKSVLNEFKPALTEKQLNAILNYIPNDPAQIKGIFNQAYPGKLIVEKVHAIGAEPEVKPAEPGIAEPSDYPANKKIELFCRLFMEHHKDQLGNPIKYKTGAAESGKMKALVITPAELELLLSVYMASDEWFTKPKSISNFINKYNEIRVLTYSEPKTKTKNFPLPYDQEFFARLSFTDQRLYWDHLRANGYKWVESPGRGGKWLKQDTL
ncbi:hypothetical protein [Mucilaginibacter lappiensis]|uniref:Uncharacterized protein n=1 Tax=Mucilaginibacter lappiensis TaxID=354630 RepID=A0A841JSU6_9SPHI|nr:hypothetical protein [Mucilaginibacter lappiensis]MBB6131355.1 hypothetical protein [Mucilaginibacter lappiensis]